MDDILRRYITAVTAATSRTRRRSSPCVVKVADVGIARRFVLQVSLQFTNVQFFSYSHVYIVDVLYHSS